MRLTPVWCKDREGRRRTVRTVLKIPFGVSGELVTYSRSERRRDRRAERREATTRDTNDPLHFIHLSKMQEYNRPRRPDPNTISYLRSLPLDEKLVHEEVEKYLQEQATNLNHKTPTEEEDEDTFPKSIRATFAAIDEIQHEVASLAGDEYGSQSIETLCRIGSTYSEYTARKLLQSVQGYVFHLSIHRFGSHVIQTLLEYSTKKSNSITSTTLFLEHSMEQEFMSNGVDTITPTTTTTTMTTLPSLQQLIIQIVNEIMPFINTLTTHICGSHVLRTLICILCGVEKTRGVPRQHEDSPSHTNTTLRLRRKKKKGTATGWNKETHSSNTTLDLQYVMGSRLNLQDEEIDTCRKQLVGAILQQLDPMNKAQATSLQELVCHVNGGPLFIVLLQSLAYVENMSYPSLGLTLTHKPITPTSVQERVLRIVPSLPKFHPNSFTETVVKKILGWEDNNNHSHSKKRANIIYTLAGHTLGSHVLEIILRISNTSLYEEICTAGSFSQQDTIEEYIEHDVSNFVIQTILCTIPSKHHVEQIIDRLDVYIQNGYILDPTKHRRGIFWRLVELSSRFNLRQEQILDSMKKGFTKLSSKKDVIKLSDCIPLLVRYQAPTKDGEHIQSDPSGLRTVYHLLRFSPRLCDFIFDGILSFYDIHDLELMACDSLASVCIFDGILDGPVQQHPFIDASKRILVTLRGRWVTIALHPIGHHVVKKLFHSLASLDDKVILVEELSKGIVRLNTKSSGRDVIVECAVKDFLESKASWSTAMKKRKPKGNIVNELVDDDSEVIGPTTHKKRKRKEARDTIK